MSLLGFKSKRGRYLLSAALILIAVIVFASFIPMGVNGKTHIFLPLPSADTGNQKLELIQAHLDLEGNAWVTISVGLGQGQICGSDETSGAYQCTSSSYDLPVSAGDYVVFSASAASGWAFDHFQTADGSVFTTQNPIQITINQQAGTTGNIEAFFVGSTSYAWVAIIVGAGSGQICASDLTSGVSQCTGTTEYDLQVTPGDTVRFSATADPGWAFDHFQSADGSLSTTLNPFSVPMTQQAGTTGSVQAFFTVTSTGQQHVADTWQEWDVFGDQGETDYSSGAQSVEQSFAIAPSGAHYLTVAIPVEFLMTLPSGSNWFSTIIVNEAATVNLNGHQIAQIQPVNSQGFGPIPAISYSSFDSPGTTITLKFMILLSGNSFPQNPYANPPLDLRSQVVGQQVANIQVTLSQSWGVYKCTEQARAAPACNFLVSQPVSSGYALDFPITMSTFTGGGTTLSTMTENSCPSGLTGCGTSWSFTWPSMTSLPYTSTTRSISSYSRYTSPTGGRPTSTPTGTTTSTSGSHTTGSNTQYSSQNSQYSTNLSFPQGSTTGGPGGYYVVTTMELVTTTDDYGSVITQQVWQTVTRTVGGGGAIDLSWFSNNLFLILVVIIGLALAAVVLYVLTHRKRKVGRPRTH